MKNYADRGGCYPPQPSASADNTLRDLHNSSYHTQPHPIIANYDNDIDNDNDNENDNDNDNDNNNLFVYPLPSRISRHAIYRCFV